MKIKAVIFDLDGTITEPFLDFKKIRIEIGLPTDSQPLLEEMLKMTSQQKKRAEEILFKYEKLAIEHSSLNKGAAETLDWLRKNKIHIGILTRNKRANALAVARKHDLDFDAIIDRDDGPVKPDAFGVHKLCEVFNVQPHQCLVVGDYLFDLQAGKSAGASTVLIRNRLCAEDFANWADYTIENLNEIIDIINRTN